VTPTRSPTVDQPSQPTAASTPASSAPVATATVQAGGCDLNSSYLELVWQPGGNISPHIKTKIATDLATTYAQRTVLDERRIKISHADATILNGKDVVVVELGQDLYVTNVGPAPGYLSLTACSLVFYNATTAKWLTTFGKGVAVATP
jgi:hypothetical protein